MVRFGIYTLVLAFPTFTTWIDAFVPKFRILLIFVNCVFTGKLETNLKRPSPPRSRANRDTLSFTLILVVTTDVFITMRS